MIIRAHIPDLPGLKEIYQPIAPWAEQTLILPGNNPRVGGLKWDEWQKLVIAAYEDPETNEITLKMASQVGKTIIITAIMVYHAKVNPAKMIAAFPNELSVDKWRNEKLVPWYRENQCLQEVFEVTRQGTLPHGHIMFPGGSLETIISGSSPSMRSSYAKVTFMDELNVFRQTQNDSDDPVALMRQRGREYGDSYKLIKSSTPGSKGDSMVDREFDLSTAEILMTPCYHCGRFFFMNLDCVDLEKKLLYCYECGCIINQRERLEMLDNARFDVTNAEVSMRHRGFHVNRLHSPSTTIESFCQAYIDDDRKTFFTGVLGISYEEKRVIDLTSEEVDELYVDFDKYPDSTITAITAAVDTQGNRFEYQIIYWYGMWPHVVTHDKVFEARDNGDAKFKRLYEAVNKWNPDIIFVDRGGNHVLSEFRRQCMKFWKPWFRNKKVYLIKGNAPSWGKDLVWPTVSTKFPYDRTISTDETKRHAHNLLNMGECSIYNGGVDNEFTKQLLAEELLEVTIRGTLTKQWVPRTKNIANEALDCFGYGIASRYFLGIDYRRGAMLTFSEVMSINEKVNA